MFFFKAEKIDKNNNNNNKKQHIHIYTHIFTRDVFLRGIDFGINYERYRESFRTSVQKTLRMVF